MIVVVKKAAAKDIQKISEPFKTKIKQKIRELENYPNIPNIKKLTNYTPTYRLRIGDYRVLFDMDMDKEIITIGRIKHRKKAY